MNSYSEVRRVRAAMSQAVDHDVRRLIAAINERRPRSVERIIDPGTKAEQCDAPERLPARIADGDSTPAAR
jgi:hypothetical protein